MVFRQMDTDLVGAREADGSDFADSVVLVSLGPPGFLDGLTGAGDADPGLPGKIHNLDSDLPQVDSRLFGLFRYVEGVRGSGEEHRGLVFQNLLQAHLRGRSPSGIDGSSDSTDSPVGAPESDKGPPGKRKIKRMPGA